MNSVAIEQSRPSNAQSFHLSHLALQLFLFHHWHLTSSGKTVGRWGGGAVGWWGSGRWSVGLVGAVLVWWGQ